MPAWLDPAKSRFMYVSNSKFQEIGASGFKARLISKAEIAGCTPVQGRVHHIGMVACFISQICKREIFAHDVSYRAVFQCFACERGNVVSPKNISVFAAPATCAYVMVQV